MDFNKLQQHFMVDKEIIEKIVKLSSLKKTDIVLEIGAGSGNLTRELAKKAKVIAVEIDAIFRKKLEKIPNIIVYTGNFLNIKIKEKFNKIVSNIPYNLCEPLLWKFTRINFETAILTVSEKFYNTLNDEKSKLIYFNEIFKIEKILDVPKESFEPAPKINSVVIKITKKENESLISSILLQKDKLLKNALIEYYSKKSTKNEARKIIEGLNENLLNKGVTRLSKKEIDDTVKYLKSKNLN